MSKFKLIATTFELKPKRTLLELSAIMNAKAELLLSKFLDYFDGKFKIRILVGMEIEFYLMGYDRQSLSKFILECERKLFLKGIRSYGITKESEPNQFEIAIIPTHPLNAAKQIEYIKFCVKETANFYQIEASFKAKPFQMQSGNALHTHVSLHDLKSNHNLFAKQRGKKNEQPILQYSIAGLCEALCESMVFFVSSESSFDRLKYDPNSTSKYDIMTPSNVSWGGNNRTVAIRLPDSSINLQKRRFEHRVAGSDANPILVVLAIIAGMTYGLEKRLPLKIDKVWGNSFDDFYHLKIFPQSLLSAIEEFQAGKILRPFICSKISEAEIFFDYLISTLKQKDK